MKKTLATALVLLSGLSFAHAQNAKKSDFNIDPNNLAQLQTLPKQTRDSLAIELKKSMKLAKNNPVSINGKDMSAALAGPMKKFTETLTELMISVLESPDPEAAEKNQRRYNALQEQLDYDIEQFTEKLEYDEDRKKIIDEFETGKYDNAKEKRDARKEMKEDLKELKKDYKEKVKDNKKDRKDELKRQAERDV